jgi:hypothetical protein
MEHDMAKEMAAAGGSAIFAVAMCLGFVLYLMLLGKS